MSKTILHILNSNSYSGAENVVITIINGFKKYIKDDVQFVYVSLDGPISEVLKENNIEFAPLKKMSVKEIKRVIKKYRPNIIHAHDFTASIVSSFATLKIPIISHIHNNSPWIKKYCINSFAYGVSCLRYKKMLGVSDSVFKEYVFGKLFIKKEQIIGNPINISIIQEKAYKAIDNDIYDVVFLGRLSEPKNPLQFVEIIREINSIIPVSAVMIGDGELRSDVERLITSYNLNDIIELKGFIKNPYGILKNSKILCIPSKWEGFGLVAVEALTLGKPVIASPVGGLPGLINSNCGSLCTTKNDFVNEILELLQNEDSYSLKSDEAIKRSNELDNIERYVSSLNELYEKILRK